MEIIKVAIIGLTGAFLAVAVKNVKSEFAMYINLGAVVILLFYVVARLTGMLSQIKALAEYALIEQEYLIILLKMIGITYIAEFAGSLCKDMGYGALATQIENFSKLSLFAISFPVIMRLLGIIGELS